MNDYIKFSPHIWVVLGNHWRCSISPSRGSKLHVVVRIFKSSWCITSYVCWFTDIRMCDCFILLIHVRKLLASKKKKAYEEEKGISWNDNCACYGYEDYLLIDKFTHDLQWKLINILEWWLPWTDAESSYMCPSKLGYIHDGILIEFSVYGDPHKY